MYTILRALDNLSTGQRKGAVFLATELDVKNIPILIEVGAVSAVRTPPPQLLTEFEEYAGEYEDLGQMLLSDVVDDGTKQKIWALLDLDCHSGCKSCHR